MSVTGQSNVCCGFFGWGQGAPTLFLDARAVHGGLFVFVLFFTYMLFYRQLVNGEGVFTECEKKCSQLETAQNHLPYL